MENPPIFDIGKWAISHGYVSHNQRVNTSNDSHFPIKNGDVPIKYCDFPIKNGEVPIKNGDLCCRKFPMETGSPHPPMWHPEDPCSNPWCPLDTPRDPGPLQAEPRKHHGDVLGHSWVFPSKLTPNKKCKMLPSGKQSQKTMERSTMLLMGKITKL